MSSERVEEVNERATSRGKKERFAGLNNKRHEELKFCTWRGKALSVSGATMDKNCLDCAYSNLPPFHCVRLSDEKTSRPSNHRGIGAILER